MLHLFSPLLGAPPRAATTGRSDTASTVGPPDKPDEQSWVYGVAGTTLPTDEDQKPTWGAFGEACDQGQSQSPIDICTSTVQPIANSSLRLHLHDHLRLRRERRRLSGDRCSHGRLSRPLPGRRFQGTLLLERN